MSVDELKRFSNDLGNNEDLKSELKKLGSDEEAILKFAQGKGYNITKEDMEKSKSGTIELSDTDLEKAAGGTAFWGPDNVILS